VTLPAPMASVAVGLFVAAPRVPFVRRRKRNTGRRAPPPTDPSRDHGNAGLGCGLGRCGCGSLGDRGRGRLHDRGGRRRLLVACGLFRQGIDLIALTVEHDFSIRSVRAPTIGSFGQRLIFRGFGGRRGCGGGGSRGGGRRGAAVSTPWPARQGATPAICA